MAVKESLCEVTHYVEGGSVVINTLLGAAIVLHKVGEIKYYKFVGRSVGLGRIEYIATERGRELMDKCRMEMNDLARSW